MSLRQELDRLAEAAVDIARIPDATKRHRGGYWLHGQLDDLFEKTPTFPGFPQEEWLDFMAIVKVLLDIIFRDAVEEPSDLIPTTITLPDEFNERYGKFLP